MQYFQLGPCPREDYTDDWRFDAYDYLNKKGFDGVVITPTNKNYQKLTGDALHQQTEWEHKAMSKASCIVFWIPRSEEHPAYTTNIEFGEWFQKKGVITGMPDNAIKNDYLKKRLEALNIPYYITLESTLEAALDSLKFNSDISNMFFTSDTHFNQERTLELSKRPFFNLIEMDLTMISNWNKLVTIKDTVIHAR